MPDATKLVKAQLQELDANYKNPINRDKWTTVQFNPDTLKVSFANQVATPSGPGDQKGTPARQFVGAGTTKLSVQVWFDCTAEIPDGALEDGLAQTNDVRKLTQRVAYFITPQETNETPPKFIPPAVRFLWGSFQFDGIMDSLEESLDFFSPEGRPLRASVSFSLSQQKIQKFAFGDAASTPPGSGGPGGAPAGTRPLAQALAGATLQGMAAGIGRGDSWQAIATANGIENPRLLAPGQLIDLNVAVKTGGSA
jgi:hypothetical protein